MSSQNLLISLSAFAHNDGDVFAEFFFTAKARRAQRKLLFSFAFERPRRNGMHAKANKKSLSYLIGFFISEFKIWVY
jgi:hypothetical protein